MCGEVKRKLVLWELTLLPPNGSQEWNTEGRVGSRCLYPLNNPFSTPLATRSPPQTLWWFDRFLLYLHSSAEYTLFSLGHLNKI